MKDSGSCSLSPEEVGISQSDRHSRIPIELFFFVGPAVFCGNINTIETPEMIDDPEIYFLDLEFDTTSRCRLLCQVAPQRLEIMFLHFGCHPCPTGSSVARVPNYQMRLWCKTVKSDHVFVCICATRHESNTRRFLNIQLYFLHI